MDGLPRRDGITRFARRVRSSLARDQTTPAGSPPLERQPPATGEPPAADPIAELLSWNVLDREFYSAQCGREFPSNRAAGRHYLNWGLQRGFSPSPLFEPEFHERRFKAQEGVDPMERARHAVTGSLGPLFDIDVYLAAHPDAVRHPGGALGHYRQHAGPETPVSVGPAFTGPVPTHGAVRERAIATAHEWAAQYAVSKGSRAADEFDAAAEAAYVARVEGLPPPKTGDAPLVSVVLAVRNRPAQVRVAVASVLGQTLRDLELIIVDDGSDDETPQVLWELAAADNRLRVLLTEPWRGVCAARNTGIAAATGRYIAFLDAGGVFRPAHLELAVKGMVADGLRAAHAVLDRGPGTSGRYLSFDGTLDHLLVKNHVSLIVLVVERALLDDIGGFDESLRRWVDHDLAIRLARTTELRLLPFIGVDLAAPPEDLDRVSVHRSPGWEFVVLAKHHLDWDAVVAGLEQRVPGRVSVLIPAYEDWRMTQSAVAAVVEAADAAGDDVEVVVVDNGSRRAVSAILAARFAAEPRVRLIRAVRNLNFALGSNLAFAHSTGGTVVFLNNDTTVRPGWLRPLVDALTDPAVAGAQPLLVYPDGSIQSAGSVFAGGDTFPHSFLSEHPAEDAQRQGTMTGFTAVTAAALAMRAADVAALRGFDPMFINGCEDVDLCLRATEALGGRFAVVTDSVVVHHESKTPGRLAFGASNRREFASRWAGRLPESELWRYERAGFSIAHVRPGPVDAAGLRTPAPVLVRPPLAATTVAERPPALRWAIKIGAHAGTRGDTWGDAHFARDLADALGRLGQQVAVDRRTAFDRSTAYLDEVTLTLRGLEPYAPDPFRTNLLWVISHPDAVTEREASRFDAVFAASASWAAERSAQWGLPVRPLLQATAPDRFQPDLLDGVDGAGPVLFVGSGRRGVIRRTLRDAILAGVDVHVYGLNWRDDIPARYLRGDYLPNAELSAAYGRARVVLNDHWTDMREHGFISNRVFDAVAAGARVISDPIDGIAEIFGPAVRTYSTPAELAALCAMAPDEFCPPEVFKLVSEEVRTTHSFDARARELLAAALAARAVP